MGMRSSFNDEDEIYFHDDLLKEFCKKNKDKNPMIQVVAEWYENHDTFSFEMLDEFKLQAYWYDDDIAAYRSIAQFLDQSRGGDETGWAEFTYEEGHPFKFMLDYDNKEIYVEYVPIVWETYHFEKNKGTFVKIPKKTKDQIKHSEVINTL